MCRHFELPSIGKRWQRSVTNLQCLAFYGACCVLRTAPSLLHHTVHCTQQWHGLAAFPAPSHHCVVSGRYLALRTALYDWLLCLGRCDSYLHNLLAVKQMRAFALVVVILWPYAGKSTLPGPPGLTSQLLRMSCMADCSLLAWPSPLVTRGDDHGDHQ